MRKSKFVWSLLVSSLLLFTCCVSPNVNLSYSKRDQIPIDSFFNIIRQGNLSLCDTITKKCTIQEIAPRASAYLIKEYKNGYIGVTAAHLCAYSPNPPELLPNQSVKITWKNWGYDIDRDIKYDVQLLKINVINDICFFHVKNLKNKHVLYVSPVAPKLHDRVHNIAAPHGIALPGIIPYFTGYFLGISKDKTEDMYSLFVKPGSSGSPILNERYEIIGMVIKGSFSIPLSVSPTYKILHDSIIDLLEKLPSLTIDK